MMKCPKRFKKFLRMFTVRDKHLFIVTNAFYTLDDPNLIDVVKTCQACGTKEAFPVTKELLLELVVLYPNAFMLILREYLITWKN